VGALVERRRACRWSMTRSTPKPRQCADQQSKTL
jgi:hypothetical protein